MDDLERLFDDTDLLESGEAVVVACSGGPDSVALLHLLFRSRPDLRLHVAHLDHRLRADSPADAEFVRELAARLGLAATVEQRDALDRDGSGPAAAARDVRLRFLEEVADEVGATAIVTGHQQDDQAETILHRLLTGAGPRGLCGIPRIRRAGGTMRYVRPLLSVPRAALRAWLEERELPYRDDPTNRAATLRARLRHEALPLLSEIADRDVRPILAATATRAVEVARALADEGRVARAFVSWHGDELHLASGIERLPAVLLHAGLVPELAHLTDARLDDGDVADLVHGRRHVAGLECVRLAQGDRIVRRVRRNVRLTACALEVPGTVVWGVVGTLETRSLSLDAAALAQLSRAMHRSAADVVDADRIDGALTLRGPRAGDRIQPLGAQEEARLGHVLQRRGVAAAVRARTPVLADRTGVILVPGVVVAERVALQPETRHPLLVQWYPTAPE